MSGVFIKKGMSVEVPAGGLTFTVGDDGRVVSELRLHVHFDVCPMWLSLGIKHLLRARAARDRRPPIWSARDEEAKAVVLEEEFEASMQSVMSAAIAIDAFYAAVQEKTAIPEETKRAWRKNRTARPTQITEVIRQGFSLKERDCRQLREKLGALFALRDQAVHPAGKLDQPVMHPELKVGVEWRFVAFRFAEAEAAMHAALSALWQLSSFVKLKEPALQRYVSTLNMLLAPVVETWPDDLTPLK